MLIPYAEAYESLHPLAIELDLEKYYDIYEISRSDIEEIEAMVTNPDPEDSDYEALKSLKLKLHQLHTVRKLFLCSLLALDANGGYPDFNTWSIAITALQDLSALSSTAAAALDVVLSESARFSLPPTPKLPLTPTRERTRTQMRKLGILSQGIRGLQAKMHILREESDRTLDSADDLSELSTSLMAHYDSIGSDLRNLMQDWEDGRAALASTIDKNERRISRASTSISTALSRSSTPSSLGGLTITEGGTPAEALKILNGDLAASRDANSFEEEEEEIFEAVALPRVRSALSREERIAKMHEERSLLAQRRQSALASVGLLRELETVIKLRPRGRTGGRMTSL